MAENILCAFGAYSARIEDTVDRMEKDGGDGVMREAIREVDRPSMKSLAAAAAMARRLQAAKQQPNGRGQDCELGTRQVRRRQWPRRLDEAALPPRSISKRKSAAPEVQASNTGEDASSRTARFAPLAKGADGDALSRLWRERGRSPMGGNKGFHVQREMSARSSKPKRV